MVKKTGTIREPNPKQVCVPKNSFQELLETVNSAKPWIQTQQEQSSEETSSCPGYKEGFPHTIKKSKKKCKDKQEKN